MMRVSYRHNLKRGEWVMSKRRHLSQKALDVFDQRREGTLRRQKREEQIRENPWSGNFRRFCAKEGIPIHSPSLSEELAAHSWDNCLSFLFWITTLDKIVKVC